MTEEELETTRLMKTMMIEQESEEEKSILEEIEEFEEKIDYIDLEENKKEKLRDLCKKIKEEPNEKTREYLFNLLQKELD